VVQSVARRPVPVSHPKLRHVQADLRSGPAAADALAGVDVLWHLAFQLWRSPGVDMAESNAAATETVIRAGPGRIVFASSAAVYGAWPSNPLPLAESWPAWPNVECAYAGQKLLAERVLAAAAPTASLRIAAVLGPNADPLVKRASKGYQRGVPAIRGVEQALQFVHEDEVAEALHLAGSASDVTGVVNVAPADWLDAAGVAAVAGSRVLRVPRRVLLRGSEVAVRLKLIDFGADRAILLNGPLALDPSLAASALGWRATRSSAEVLEEFLAALHP
jgi:nucleoside-diphosphate-sugar epimerase